MPKVECLNSRIEEAAWGSYAMEGRDFTVQPNSTLSMGSGGVRKIVAQYCRRGKSHDGGVGVGWRSRDILQSTYNFLELLFIRCF